MQPPAKNAAPIPPARRSSGSSRNDRSISPWAIASIALAVGSLLRFLPFANLLAFCAIISGSIALGNIRQSQGTASGRGYAHAGIWISVLSIVGWIVIVFQKPKSRGEEAPRTALQIAEENILTKKGGVVATGNTPEAEALAAAVAEGMKTLREAFFTKRNRPSISVAGGEFLTHCELHDATCAFLIHAPDLRNFDGEAKVALNDLAWYVAQSALAESRFPEDGRLAVGLKGLLMYDDIRSGRHVKAVDEEAADNGVESRGLGIEDIRDFFPDSPSKAGAALAQ